MRTNGPIARLLRMTVVQLAEYASAAPPNVIPEIKRWQPMCASEAVDTSFTDDKHRYAQSDAWLERSLRVIPLASQTFSKSVTHFPRGVSPFFVTRARGSHMWDVDGNEYIDLMSALCSITLGHCDPDVSDAVAAQLRDGTIFSLPHTLETEVAEMICDIVPCAEMVRFGKNGSDATSGAIRVARAYTSREHILVCGYHGWQDWYIGTTPRNKGVPEATRSLTHTFPYNDLSALDQLLAQLEGKVAAVIMEPMNDCEPKPGYLQGVKERAHNAGAVLIFDEMVTGFRLSLGGAQEKFGVVPDMATLGKGLANGYPLSAVVGSKELMREMEDVFFSLTMGGEALSLAAAKATLLKLRREPVIETVRERGLRLQKGTLELATSHGLRGFFDVSGHPAWAFLRISDAPTANSYELRTLFMQEVQKRGLLCNSWWHSMSYAHSETDVDSALAIYDEVFPMLRDAGYNGALGRYLHCEPLQPIFKVR